MKLFSSIDTSARIGLAGLVASLQHSANQAGNGGFATKEIGGMTLGLEGLNEHSLQSVRSSADSLKQVLKEALLENDSFKNDKLTIAQESAATFAGMAASNVEAFLRKAPAAAPQGAVVVETGVSVPRMALEAYDERENRNAAVYSAAYNLQAARQDEFGEAFFPTVPVSPEQVGYVVSLHLINVYNEVRRNASGAITNFGRKNIVHALRDASILRNDKTKIVPVHSGGSAGFFVATSLIPTSTYTLADGEAVTTSALAFGKKFSLLGISQTTALLATGQLDSTDAIEPAVALDTLYIQLTDGAGTPVNEVISFPVSQLALANFTSAPQGNYRAMNLAFQTNALLVTKDTKTIAGAVPTLMAALIAADAKVRLSITISGSVNLETAETSLMTGEVLVDSITDSAGNNHAPGSASVAAIEALFTGVKQPKAIGYTLDARRTNSNLRQRGKLLDVTVQHQIYNVPLLAPITTPRPLGGSSDTDASDLGALITATRISTSNAAVTEILKFVDQLKTYVDSRDLVGDIVDLQGVARWVLTPTFIEKTLDMAVSVDSQKSFERAADIRGTLVNTLRDISSRLVQRSGFKAAADALAGGIAGKPTVIVGTDQVTAQWLLVEGDARLLGDFFNVKVVVSQDSRVYGKIFVALAPAEAQEGAPHPLSFGNMAWKPELVLTLPIHRNGANSKELTVQPSFVHITNAPVMGVVTVTGLPEVAAGKVISYWDEK